MTTAAAPTSRPELEPASGSLLQVLRDVAQVHGFTLDPAQERAVSSFRRLYDDLFHLERRQRSWLRLWSRRRRVRGIYLWGPVGTGKSFLMDEFFRLVPLEKKQRIHFHRFMQDIHHRLRALQGQPDPLKLVAADVGRETQLLCLDEFHVTDIGDAMLIRGLLEGLVEQQVVLVTTSNQQPDQLYAHGLQRARFLPAIELIKGNLSVVALDGGSDYRLRTLTRAGVYHHPVDAAADRALDEGFLGIAGEVGAANVKVEIEGRQIVARRVAPGTIWFDFGPLCEGPRGTADYIELARRYHTVLVAGVPQFRSDQVESLRRFTWLVDEFYDRQVKLILSAEMPVERLYDKVPGRADIERTRSRLIEMQTIKYLSLPHLA
jgi:cell division protein ZapE